MTQKIIGPEIERIIQLLARLPGLGPRSARKAALALMRKRSELLEPLAQALSLAVARIVSCTVCGNLDTQSPCRICADERRDPTLIVVVEDIGDLWALERAEVVRGKYHILGGHLSPLDGIGPGQLNVSSLIVRAQPPVSEVLLALNSTVEGQSTVHYLREQLTASGVTVSVLARGIPIGGELDYLDDGTLAAAIKSRKHLL